MEHLRALLRKTERERDEARRICHDAVSSLVIDTRRFPAVARAQEAVRVWRKEAVDVPCPTCSAPPGTYCQSTYSFLTDWTHPERVRARWPMDYDSPTSGSASTK